MLLRSLHNANAPAKPQLSNWMIHRVFIWRFSANRGKRRKRQEKCDSQNDSKTIVNLMFSDHLQMAISCMQFRESKTT